MARKLTAETPLDEHEEEALFTQAAVHADPDAEALAPLTNAWLSVIDVVREKERQVRRAVVAASAQWQVANARLDAACVAFSDDLLAAVRKDRSSPRFRKFFPDAPTRWVRQPLTDQVDRVTAWLSAEPKDDVLEKHRAELHRWNEASKKAITATRGTALVRGEAQQARAELGENMTRSRDGLHDALSEVARERSLPRDWPDGFFRTRSTARNTGGGEPVDP